MAKKRKTPYPTSNNDSSSYSKRPRPSYKFTAQEDDDDSNPNSSTLGVEPRLDPTYGQRGAFPGLDDDDGNGDRWGAKEEDTLFYGPASDGLEYLRMVR